MSPHNSASLSNPAITALGAHPFPRIARLLAGLDPAPGLPPLDMSIGEPQVGPPGWATALISESPELWRTYPPNQGPARFRQAARAWLARRFDLGDPAPTQLDLVPTAGAREALFQVGLLVAGRAGRGLIAMPTPHYAPYRAAAFSAGLRPLYLAAMPETGYLLDLDVVEAHADGLAALLLCSPSNPEGVCAPAQYLARALELARRHDFVLVVDECYSELYHRAPPIGALEVAWRLGGARPARNLVTINSLSKRSGAAGLRVGLVAGDPELVAALVSLRAYGGGTTPLPNLVVGAALYEDETHVREIRAGYRASFSVAEEVLSGTKEPTGAPGPGGTTDARGTAGRAGTAGLGGAEAGMFLWLPVLDDEAVVREAWRRAAVRLVPGGYLGPAGHDGRWPGRTHVRVAMTYSPDLTREALERLRPVLEDATLFPRSAEPTMLSRSAEPAGLRRPAEPAMFSGAADPVTSGLGPEDPVPIGTGR